MYDECKSQGQAKAMCWVGLLDGKAIGPFWVDGTMDRFVYADLLEKKSVACSKSHSNQE